MRRFQWIGIVLGVIVFLAIGCCDGQNVSSSWAYDEELSLVVEGASLNEVEMGSGALSMEELTMLPTKSESNIIHISKTESITDANIEIQTYKPVAANTEEVVVKEAVKKEGVVKEAIVKEAVVKEAIVEEAMVESPSPQSDYRAEMAITNLIDALTAEVAVKESLIPSGTHLNRALVLDGHLLLDFSQQLLNYGGTSWEEALVDELLSTAFSVDGVQWVTIRIDGECQNLVEGTTINRYTRENWNERKESIGSNEF
ncbi:MAG: GerMN domain-containing protein [Vallitaleaceae bacterium]|nr:GerMN domain-containing protein [Vallitaleaceae bacterium]